MTKVLVFKDGKKVVRDAQEGELPEPPTIEEVEADVQAIADSITQGEERMMALALATVDLRMANIPAGATTAQVRQQFRDRVVFYLRQRRGI